MATTSPSSSRAARPHELPSRHTIGGASGSSLKDQLRPLRPHQPTPTRVKLRHAATTPSTIPLASDPASSDESHACHNCHQMDTRFYCDPCLSSRLEAHHTEIRRLSLARDKAKASVSHLLFQSTSNGAKLSRASSSSQITPGFVANEGNLPDPFDTNAAEPSTSSASQHVQLLLHSLVQLRARRAAILSRVQTIHQCISESQQAHLQGKEELKEKRAHLVLRQQNLAKAWSGLEGSSATSSSSAAQRSRHAAKSRWLAHPAADNIDVPLIYTDVYTHYERQDDEPDNATIPASTSKDQQLGATLTRARLQLASLQADASSVSAELSAIRSALARQAVSLYSVTPPGSSVSKASGGSSSSKLRQRQVDLSASASVAQRISRLSERYIPGAFGLGHAQSPLSLSSQTRNANGDVASSSRQASSANSSPSSPSSSHWSIASLPLPLPSETRRNSRETVNGAVTYAANLLQLLAGYLGITLPFSIEQHKGRLAIRPDPLWDGGGGSSAKTLYLSSSAYSHLTASHAVSARSSKLNTLAESTFGLGASTISTIESYIHLPSGGGLPWGLSSTASSSKPASSSADADSDAATEHKSEENSRTSSATGASISSGSKSKPDQAAKSFVSALVMLNYNVAYLAAKQGLQIDLVAAAANPLQLLAKIIQQPQLGRLAHANHIHASSIQDLSMPLLDYEQLAQILEPMNAAADGYKRGASRSTKPDSSNTAPSSQISSKAVKTPKVMEQSYVDVGEAAASVLNIKDPSAMPRKPSPQPAPSRTPSRKPSVEQKTTVATIATGSSTSRRSETVSSLQKQRIGADSKHSTSSPTSQPPPSLDFLRQRGRDVSKAKSSDPARGDTSATVSEEQKEVSAKPAAVRPGAVIFNGVEVGVASPDAATTSRPASTGRALSQKSRKQSTEEGWDLL